MYDPRPQFPDGFEDNDVCINKNTTELEKIITPPHLGSHEP